VRLRFALAASLPALAALAIMGFLGDRLARNALEAELGARLVAVAQSAAASLAADRVASLAPGDEGSRTYANVRARLQALSRATRTRIYLARPERTALVDADGAHRIGDPLPALERDRFELGQVERGRALSSAVLFEGSDGELYKTGYAPVVNGTGKVVAFVAVDGTAPSFAVLRRFRHLLVAISIGGAVLAALVAILAAVSVTRPLRTLAAGARRIGGGDLSTPLLPASSAPEVETLRATLDEMREALRRRDQERESMLAGIAHEVRNPLGAMELFAGLLSEDLRGRPEELHVARIRAELASLERLVDEFLEYARPRPLQLDELDASTLATELRDLATPLASEGGVGLVATGAGTFRADGGALRRAALNLVRNAVEAAPAGSTVEIELAVRDRTACIEVRDRGPGLSGEARERLFEPFFTTKERGTGLGLALARKTADAHGGRVVLAPREGGGTVARIELPRAPADGFVRAGPVPA
jgi:signal transduction histidine kinase